MLSEVAAGYQVSRSSNEGQLADTQTRSFRVMLNAPAEGFDIQGYCGVYIGDPHPVNTNVFCTSFDTRFDGDSRMVLICTFQYASQASQGSSSGGGGGGSQSPDVRLANWTIGSALYEIPIWNWRERTGQNSWGAGKRAANGANDMYDGVSALDALVTISVSQFEMTDPGRHARHVGAINENEFTLGSLVMQPHTVMLRGISSQPKVESWGPTGFWSGWTCTYEFAYKENLFDISVGADEDNNIIEVALGWDIAVPQTGFSVRAFDPPGRDIDDPFGQPLEQEEDTLRVKFDGDDPSREPKIKVGARCRAMMKITTGGGVSQLPSAQPIAINDNGRPRADDLPPIVRGYQVHRAINFLTVLGLRTGAA